MIGLVISIVSIILEPVVCLMSFDVYWATSVIEP